MTDDVDKKSISLTRKPEWFTIVFRETVHSGGEAQMMIRNFDSGDGTLLYRLWKMEGGRFGYAPLSEAKFWEILLEHPAFSPEFTLVLEDKGHVRGFVSGCLEEQSGDIGYMGCLLLEEQTDTVENTALLIGALEDAFRKEGIRYCAVSFFNPIRLPWVIPGTDNHQHNNLPGVPTDMPLYERMQALGYEETSRECGLYYDLATHRTPEWVEEKAVRMEQRGYTVARYDSCHHRGLEEMAQSLGNPQWSVEIPAAGKAGMDLLVGLKGNVCAGFTGPVYPEETGRGYLSGLAVAPQYERNGLGTLLFYRLLQREKEVGARYMSIFTGVDNRAKNIYLEAGFRIVRTFAVMRKEL